MTWKNILEQRFVETLFLPPAQTSRAGETSRCTGPFGCAILVHSLLLGSLHGHSSVSWDTDLGLSPIPPRVSSMIPSLSLQPAQNK